MSTVKLRCAQECNGFGSWADVSGFAHLCVFAPLCKSRHCWSVHAKPQRRKEPQRKTRSEPSLSELHVHLMRNDAALVAFGQQASDSFTPAFAVVES